MDEIGSRLENGKASGHICFYVLGTFGLKCLIRNDRIHSAWSCSLFTACCDVLHINESAFKASHETIRPIVNSGLKISKDCPISNRRKTTYIFKNPKSNIKGIPFLTLLLYHNFYAQ